MRGLKRKMKLKFVLNKLAVYISCFTVPVMLLGGIIIWGFYQIENDNVLKRLDNTLSLCKGTFVDMYQEAAALNRYLSNSGQMAFFYQIFIKERVDYAANLTIKHISSYLISETATNPDIDSIYFYIENHLDRVITSEDSIVQISSMGDNNWVKEFNLMKAGEYKILMRTIAKDEISSMQEVCSVFMKFSSWNGGIVVNYKKRAIERILKEANFYDNQKIAVFDESQNQILGTSINSENDESAYLQASLEYNPFKIRIFTYCNKAIINSSLLSNVGITLILIVATIISSLLLSYYRSVYSYNQLYGIIDLFEKAENNEKLPELKYKRNDLYSIILENILHTFLENRAQYDRLRESRYHQIKAETAALQYQISPHFLFNTIQAINYEILEYNHGTYTVGNKMLENLSDILRYSLENPKIHVAIERELQICKKYLEIQSMRYNKKIKIICRMENNLENIKIPKMILQPVLENSISHGLRNKDDNCIIYVKISSNEEWIKISIMDNGIGIESQRLEKIQEELKKTQPEYREMHIGLGNVNQRLLLEFTDFTGLHLSSRKGLGTVVWFKIPKKYVY